MPLDELPPAVAAAVLQGLAGGSAALVSAPVLGGHEEPDDAQVLGTNRDRGLGGEFGVERSKFWYDFGPIRLTTGWDVTWADLKTGGLLYGDDHPFIMLSGKAGDTMDWQVNMLIIEDSDDLNGEFTGKYRDSDWYAYIAKMNFKVGGLTLSPFACFSDMRNFLFTKLI